LFPINCTIIEQMQATGINCREPPLINAEFTDLTAHYHLLEREALFIRLHGDGQGVRGLKPQSKFNERTMNKRMSSQRVASLLPIAALKPPALPAGNALPRIKLPKPVAQLLDKPVGIATGLRRNSQPITIPRCSVNPPPDQNTPRRDRRLTDFLWSFPRLEV
jgi:hypothetical protein